MKLSNKQKKALLIISGTALAIGGVYLAYRRGYLDKVWGNCGGEIAAAAISSEMTTADAPSAETSNE